MTDVNELIIKNLQALLQDALAQKDVKNTFRAKAYRKAIASIKKADSPITSGKEALQLEGVGKKIADKIQEIIDTGKLHQVEDLGVGGVEKSRTIDLFTQIWGVGPVKARELWESGARSLEDIDPASLTDNQRLGLTHFKDLQQRVCKEDVEQLSIKILQEIRKLQKERGWVIKSRVCGSFRRRAETCGDMDILLCPVDGGDDVLPAVVERLQKAGLLMDTLGIGRTKYLGLTRAGGIVFRIDFEIVSLEEWPFALLYFTGSGKFNEKQRGIAKKMGYSLSEHGLKNVKTGEYVQGLKNERDIFDFLGMEYLSPWERGL